MSIGTPGQTRDFFRPIASDGSIVRKITQEEYESRKDSESGAVRRRDWTAGTKNGTSFEEVYRDVRGRIVAINFTQHDEMGQSIELTLRTDEGDEGVFAVNTSSPFGQSLMEVLPNVNFEKPVRINAWTKERDGKTKKKIFVAQENDKGEEENIPSHYQAWNEKKKQMDTFNDYPKVNEKEKAKYKDKYWTTRFFPEVEIFLVEQVEKKVIPQLKNTEITEVVEDDEI